MRTALRKALGTSGPAHRTLTTSGFEITDASRALGIQGDGLLNDSSMGIWPPATNLCTNGGFETNTTGWFQFQEGISTFVRSTSDFKFGAACGLITVAGGGGFGQRAFSFVSTPANGAVYTVSIWVKATGTGVGQSVILRLWGIGGAGADAELASAMDTVTGDWVRLRATGTIDAADRTNAYLAIQITGLAPDGAVMLIDGAQAELSSVATPYIETDGATAARSAARVQMPVAGLFTPTQGWVAARMRMGWVNTADPSGNPVVFDWRDDANNLLQLRFDTTGNTWEVQRRNTGGTGEVTVADTFALSAAVTVIAAWDAANLKVSVDGGTFTSAAAVNIPTLAASTLDIGSIAGTSEHIASDVRTFATGRGTLSNGDAASIHTLLSAGDPQMSQLPGSPTGLWTAVNGVYEIGDIG